MDPLPCNIHWRDSSINLSPSFFLCCLDLRAKIEKEWSIFHLTWSERERIYSLC
jgi:hypothetical protein